MKALSIYISQLLYNYDCISVPMLGAFVASRIPATIDTKRGLIFPPRKELIFNSELQFNDGLLVSSIAKIENITFEQANKFVSSEVNNIRLLLNKGNVVMLSGLGTLAKNDNRLVFVADKNINYLTESYGLSVISVADIHAGQTPNYLFNNIRKVATSAAMVIGLLLISSNVHDGQPTGLAEAGYSQLFQLQAPQIESNEITNAITPTIVNETSADNFHIIVASFATQSEADKYIKNMNNKGIDGLRAIQKGKRFRVSAASFDNHDDAVEYNKTIRTIQGFEKAWIFTNK